MVADAVNDMAVRIEKQMADQRELLATVSHELRTPLARVRIISEIARENGATPKTFDDLDREVVEMDTLAGELLASSRVDFGLLSVRPLSLRDVMTRAAERCGIEPAKIAIEGDADAMKGDPTLLQRALANLFDNAIKHGHGVEVVKATIEGAVARFEVFDQGPGFKTGETEALFEKFKRSEEARVEGLGLGLALVKKIVVAHNGRPWALNRPKGGAVVGFEIAIS